ncbi:hypothetical protein GE09DRAFT_1221204 [Coniochaeta sp. 2T2.1]|nr:hypothetical protein GE09DRAFT_1221204 [Coniochaeta sp. 2T2.1]
MDTNDGARSIASFEAPAPSDPRPRRMSMEEDMFYRELMTQRPPPARPPSYETAVRQPLRQAQASTCGGGYSGGGGGVLLGRERLPNYSCDVHAEGVFQRKMEIEDTVKRAEYRNWHQVYVVLHGTSLNVYQVKKDRGWWSSNKNDGPTVSPDNPPWCKMGTLEKSYSLLHADAGIAADYRKRRYVIRLRAETDQFLLSCVELGTFVNWLDLLFAALGVAAPLDERDFPRDQSIPRMQRIRWLRGLYPRPGDNATGFQRLNARRPSMASSSNDQEEDDDEAAGVGDQTIQEGGEAGGAAGPSRIEGQHPVVGRLSTTSYPNESINPDTGKWEPRHPWTLTHDQLYAKLCFSVLLFKSPRKSNYVICKGKQWYVDWQTGRMVRVLPPAYGEVLEPQGLSASQSYVMENRLI